MPQSSSHRQQQQGSPELAPSTVQSAQSPTSSHQPAEQSGSSARKISCQDIQLVQNLIERCLMLYMNRKDVVQTLQTMAKVEPGFTSLVWMKLEEQNPDFFKAYYTRLKLKMHIATFNHLLGQQADLMRKLGTFPSQVYHSPVQMVPIHPGTPSPRQSQAGAQPAAGSDTDVDLATPSAGETAENMFAFGATSELPGMNIESNFVHHDPQSMDGLQADGDGISSRDNLSTLPRNFSLSDLTADLGNNKFPRNFSLSDLTADLGPDFGGLGNYSSAFVSGDADATYLQSPEKDGFDDEPMLEFVD